MRIGKTGQNSGLGMTRLLHNQSVAWLAVALWMTAIFILSAQPELPRAPEPLLDTLLKKSGHALGYAVLAGLVYHAMRLTWPGRSARWHAGCAFGFAVAYALSDEWHQSFVPGRTPALLDVGIDTVGAVIGLTLIMGWTRRYRPAK